MPREQINFPPPVETHYGSIDENGVTEQHSEIRTDPAVHVNWHNVGNDHDGHVQVALECDREYLKELVEKLQDEDRICVSSSTLSRSDVNKLVRVSRRARDQAYGRDE